MRRLVAAAPVVVAGLFPGAVVAATPGTPPKSRDAMVPARCVAAAGTREMWQDLTDGDRCVVVASGPVAGATPPVFYQVQAYLAAGQTPESETVAGELSVGGPDNDGAGVVLLTRAAGGGGLVTLAGWSGSGAVVYRPRTVGTVQGPILLVPMGAAVSSAPDDDAVFRMLGGRWVAVSTEDWSAGVTFPPETEQWRGNAMDWPTLRAYGGLWRKTDAECCPTGGSYIATLRFDGARLVLTSVRYSRGELPFP